MDEIGGNHQILGIPQNTFQFPFGSLFHGSADLPVGSRCFQICRQIHHGNVDGRHTHAHSGQASRKFRDHFTHGLRCAGGRRNNIIGGRTSAAPVLQRLGIHRVLGGCHGMDGGHKAGLDTEPVVEHLRHRCQTVGGAGSIGNNAHGGIVSVQVHSADEHRRIIRGRRNHYLSSPGINMGLAFGYGLEFAGGLDQIVHPVFAPVEIGRVTVAHHGDLFPVDNDGIVRIIQFGIPFPLNGVILQHIHHIIRGIGGIDGLYVNVRIVFRRPKHQPSDAAETGNAHRNAHIALPPVTSYL